MSIEDRLAEIERRLAALEGKPVSRVDVRPAEPPPRFNDAPPPPPPPVTPLLTETWLGQRGLLAVGVLLVLLAAGYLLKLAFDRGWISPAVRCIGGVAMGLVTAGIGARILKRGLRMYGATLIGLGFGIIYLALWAATTLYGLVPPTVDIAALTLSSLALAAVAYQLDVEALAVAAAAGAFLSPVAVSTDSNPDAFLVYLALVGATIGAASATKRWRYATFIVAAAVFGLGLAAADAPANPYRILPYALLAGTAGLFMGLRERWPETRLLAFSGGWGLLASAELIPAQWLIAVGGMVLAAPVWWRALNSTTIWPDPVGREAGEGEWSLAETFYFYMTPLLLVWAAAHLAPIWFATNGGGPWLLVAIAYAIPAFRMGRIPFTVVTAVTLAGAALAQWPSLAATWALLLMMLAWAAMDHPLERFDGRWYALGAGMLALIHLLIPDLDIRPYDGSAFTDRWALTLWMATLSIAALASGGWKREVQEGVGDPSPVPNSFRSSWATGARTWPPIVPGVLWGVAGILLLFGVTGELLRHYRLSPLPPATARLWSGLAVSAWWTLFAGALVAIGFATERKPVRLAGLAVAGLAVTKVLLSDLASLDALYRVGSVFILGLVSLALAYLYHRHQQTRG